MSMWMASQSLLAITMMVVIAYGSRVVGLVVMSRVPLGPRVRLFVDAMSSSVLIAVIAPMIAHGDGGTRLAAIVAGITAVWFRSPLIAITVGVCGAALWRWI